MNFDYALPYTVSYAERMTGILTEYIRTCLEWKIPVLQTNVAEQETMQEKIRIDS